MPPDPKEISTVINLIIVQEDDNYSRREPRSLTVMVCCEQSFLSCMALSRANDFVNAKTQAREKPQFAGYVTDVTQLQTGKDCL